LAFVATPPLLMAAMLTTRPLQGLGLRAPPWWAWPAGALLAVLLFLPLGELTWSVYRQFPELRDRLRELHDALPSGGPVRPPRPPGAAPRCPCPPCPGGGGGGGGWCPRASPAAAGPAATGPGRRSC